jgi:hypothetical protein
MRHGILAACVVVPAAAFILAPAQFFSTVPAAASMPRMTIEPDSRQGARDCNASCDRAWLDANVRLDQIQVVGTAHSAKQKPEGAVMRLIRMGGKDGAQALDFGQPALSAQLDNDVRVLRFSVVHDPQGGRFRHPAAASMAMTLLDDGYVAAMSKPGFKVLPVPDVDYRTSCLALAACLKEVADWSAAHPGHLPITIVIHTIANKTPIPGATRPLPIDAAALAALDGEVRAAFAPDRMITPAAVRGDYPSLRAAAAAHHWPLLGQGRGKVMVVLEGDGAAAYRGDAMFKAAATPAADVAVLSLDDPRAARRRIAAALDAGLMVITRADEDTREARAGDTSRRDSAFATGAQLVLTDFLMPDPAVGTYQVSLAVDPQARCGRQLAPEHCIAVPQGRMQHMPRQPLIAAAAP